MAPFSPNTVAGKLVIAGISLCLLDFFVIAGADLFGPGFAGAIYPRDDTLHPAFAAINIAVFLIGAMGFCLVVSGAMFWFIHELGGVNHDTDD